MDKNIKKHQEDFEKEMDGTRSFGRPKQDGNKVQINVGRRTRVWD